MTNEELCLRVQADDADAAEELISRNMGFIRSLALWYEHGFRSASMDADDYIQEGAVALLRAASQFDPARRVKFLSYAGQAVRNAIIDTIRTDDPNTAQFSFDDPLFGPDDAKDTSANLYLSRIDSRLPSTYDTDPEHIFIQKEKLEELYSAIRSLSPRDHAWVMCRYGFDDDVYKPFADMCRIYHISESRAKKTEKEALSKLKKMLKTHS